MQAGFPSLNSVTVIQRTQALAEYLLANVHSAEQRGVVVSGDTQHDTEKSSRLATAVLVAKGIKVYRYDGVPNHAPLVPFGVNFLNAAAGVIISASNDPVQDGRYKVYWSNGCQITPPVELEIAGFIRKDVEPTEIDESVVDDSILVERDLGHVREAYVRAVAAATTRHYQADFEQSPLHFVYTPMYGVGLPFFESVVAELKIPGMTVVPQQASSDADSPTFKVPDVMEKGALDLATETADAAGIDLILANDPDAGRLTVAEKVQEQWHQFTGDQLGVLIAAHVFETYPRDTDHPLDKLALLASIECSKMLRHMCEEEGILYKGTRPGFEWLGNAARDLEAEGYDVQFAYEEASGYMVPAVVHDKDGTAAAALFLTAAQRWRTQGLTPRAKLQKLHERYSYWDQANTYLISPSAAVTKQVFANLRSSSGYETVGRRHKGFQWGHRKVNWWRDLTEGYESHRPDHKPELPIDESSEMISLGSENRIWATMLAMPTESKIKIYVDAKGDNKKEARWRAYQMCGAIINEWFQPQKYRLKLTRDDVYP